MLRATTTAIALAALLTAQPAWSCLQSPGNPGSAEFRITWQSGQLTISGNSSSDGHEETMRSVASSQFPASGLSFELARASGLPPGWSLLTEQALRTLAETLTGNATIDTTGVRLRGIHIDKAAWRKALAALSATLLPGMQLQDETTTAERGRSLADHCRQQFATATRNRQVDFQLNSDELRPSAYPLLDAIVELVADCPTGRIIVTGHTDASGNAALNVDLSRRRALAVIEYIVGRGIPAARLSARGAGATQPLDDQDTRAARARNRRIEFEYSPL